MTLSKKQRRTAKYLIHNSFQKIFKNYYHRYLLNFVFEIEGGVLGQGCRKIVYIEIMWSSKNVQLSSLRLLTTS